MSTHHRVKIAALENQAFALMSRLHVALRRQTGRITDIEYMRLDPAYCQHVIGLATGSDNTDLITLGVKLQEIYFGEEGLFVLTPPKPPLLARRDSTLPSVSPPAPLTPPVSPAVTTTVLPAVLEAPRPYVGTLR